MTAATQTRADKITTAQKPQEKTCWQCGQTFSGGELTCPNDGTRLIAITLGADHDPLLGQTIDGRYTLEARLGEGGMGTVYQATELDAGREVAIKVLKADYLRDENIRRRFMHEARIVANLEHPNAVQLFDFGMMLDGNFYMVMELLRGESLADRLAYKFLSYYEIFQIIPPVCEVLHEAHTKGVIHRDLKPENLYIRVGEDGRETPKLIDFGVAKQLEAKTMTRTGTLWGTPAYMSPEQARGDEIGAAADIYAMGIIIYELICGNLPFHASTQMGYALKHMNETPRSMLSLPGMHSIPPELDELILRTLAKDPSARPASMLDFARELERLKTTLFGDVRLISKVPAEEVDPVALQDWMRGGSPDNSSELFPLDVPHKPQRPSTPSTSAPQLPTSFSALDQLEDSIDLPREQPLPAPDTPVVAQNKTAMVVAGALLAALVVGLGWWAASGRGGETDGQHISAELTAQGAAEQEPPVGPDGVVGAPASPEEAPINTRAAFDGPPNDFAPPPTTDQAAEAMGVGAMRGADVVVRARILTGDQLAEPAEVLKNAKRSNQSKRWRPNSTNPSANTTNPSTRPTTSNAKIKNTLQKIF